VLEPVTIIVCPAQEAVGYTGVTKSWDQRKPILTIEMCSLRKLEYGTGLEGRSDSLATHASYGEVRYLYQNILYVLLIRFGMVSKWLLSLGLTIHAMCENPEPRNAANGNVASFRRAPSAPAMGLGEGARALQNT
jgi:hypothetical protein